MSEEIKNPETNEAEKPKEMDFTNFLTAEDEFRMEMEKYIRIFSSKCLYCHPSSCCSIDKECV